MLEAGKQAQLDQAAECFGDTVPPLLWKLYSGLLRQGFTEAQALSLCATQLAILLRPSVEGQ